MKNGDIKEFLDLLYLGQDLVFVFHGQKFFLEGWFDKGESTMALDIVSSEVPFSGYVWEYTAKTMKECADAFLAAPIWEGKEFLQVESEVEWTEWWDEPSGS